MSQDWTYCAIGVVVALGSALLRLRAGDVVVGGVSLADVVAGAAAVAHLIGGAAN